MLSEKIQSLENGFQLFDWYHLSWLFLTVLVIYIMFILYRGADLAGQRKIKIRWALVILVLESIKNVLLIIHGDFSYDSLPLHLCGLGIFIVLVHAFLKDHRMDMLLYCLTMPGAFMSLVTPNWTDMSAFNYFHFHSFFFHLLLFAYPVTMLLSKELKLSVRKNMATCFIFMCDRANNFRFECIVGNELYVPQRSSGRDPINATRALFWQAVLYTRLHWTRPNFLDPSAFAINPMEKALIQVHIDKANFNDLDGVCLFY